MKNLFIFLAGAALGACGTYVFLDKKYAKRADEEIESVKKAYGLGEDKNVCEEEEETLRPEEVTPTPAFEQAEEKIKNFEKVNYSKIARAYVDGPTDDDDEEEADIELILPDEFGTFSDYDAVTYTYYAGDGVLEDEFKDEIIEDIESVIGTEALSHFGDFEEDVVHVRNNVLKMDIEICRVDYCYHEE